MNPEAADTLFLPFTSGALAPPQRALFLGAVPHTALHGWQDVAGWQPWKHHAAAWEEAGFSRCDSLLAEKFPLVLVLPGKSRDEILSWLGLAEERLEDGGRMIVAIPNPAGAARFEKEFAAAAGGVESFPKNKCRVFHAEKSAAWDAGKFAEWRGLSRPAEIPGTRFTTVPGIFSAGHIDAGSAFLSSHLPAGLKGSVADLGAGWGFLTAAVLRRCPGISRAELFEADARALECARENLAGLPGEISYHWHDVTGGIPGTFDNIVINPPFHTGRKTDIGLGLAFLTAAHGALRRSGNLWLVANRQLPYENTLRELGFSTRNVAENPVFKIITAIKR